MSEEATATLDCAACKSSSEPYFSRTEPMGYFCPDCGVEEGKSHEGKKRFHGFVGEWVACAEEMPDDEITVMVWLGEDAALAFHDSEVLDRRGDSGWIVAGSSRVLVGVTHWCREILPPNDQVGSGLKALEPHALFAAGFVECDRSSMKAMPEIKKDIERLCPTLDAEEILKVVGYIRDLRNAAFKAGSGENPGGIAQGSESLHG